MNLLILFRKLLLGNLFCSNNYFDLILSCGFLLESDINEYALDDKQ